MKMKFLHTLLRDLIDKKDFIPVRDQEGSLHLSLPAVLTKVSFGSRILVEFLDGDRMTAEEIAFHLQENSRMLQEMEDRSSHVFFEVFLFDVAPGPEKEEVLADNQLHNVSGKKFLKVMGIDLSVRAVNKFYKTMIADSGISGTAGDILAKGDFEDIGEAELLELIDNKQRDYKVELKAGVPFVTYALIGINLLVAGLLYLYSLKSGTSYNQLLQDFGAKVNLNILQGEYWRFVTPVFLHAGIMHLLINCYSLYAVGVAVEKMFGRFRFLSVYFIAGILGNLLSFMFSPNPGVGASGAIFGLLGTMLYYGLERPAVFKAYFGGNILVTIVVNLAYGFSNTGIDNFAHIGGLIGGFLASGMVAKPEKVRWYFNRWLYLILTAVIVASGLAYGFHSKQNKIVLMTDELEALEQAQNWSGLESKAEDILQLQPSAGRVKMVALLSLTKAEALSNKYEEAVGHAKELTALEPAMGHYMQGVLYYDMQQYELSKKELLAAKEAGATYEQIDQLLSELEK